MEKSYHNILDYIGNTPLVQLKSFSPKRGVEIYAKLESFNPGGSVKDRPALFMIEGAEKRGELTGEKIILEATSGNTGIGLAWISAIKGYRCLFVMSEAVSEERKKILRAFGADLYFTPSDLGTDGAIEYAYSIAREEPQKYWLADQFNNPFNWHSHYHGTALEIWKQTHGQVDMVVSAIGTTGTIMGISRRLKEFNQKILIVGVEPYLGHKIQGLKNMKESYSPGIFEKARVDYMVNVEDEEAFDMARQIAKREGLLVGMSSGAALCGALKVSHLIDRGKIVVIFPDGGERYLSTPLFMYKRRSGILLFNTLKREVEELSPIEEDTIQIFSCGPTLCKEIDIAEARRLVFADFLCRYLKSKGYGVRHVMSLTDLDDNTIEGAMKRGIPLRDFTDNYFKKFTEVLKLLNIKVPTEMARTSDHIKDMIEIVKGLMEKGYAYEKLRSIYFDISRFKEYGKLSKIDMEKIKIGKTVDLERYEKENPRDFTLFKRSTLKELKEGIYFHTPWGNGRPSWHLECVTVAMMNLERPYDIYTSGVELIFPHHENSIAICEALNGRALANHWIHNEQVISERDWTVKDLIERGYGGKGIRFWLLSRHYRRPLIFSFSKLKHFQNTLFRLNSFIRRVHFAPKGRENPDIDQYIYDLSHGFASSLDKDLNVAWAISHIYKFMRRINPLIETRGIGDTDKEKIINALSAIDSILGIMDMEISEEDMEIDRLVEERDLARKAKDWKRADQIRERLKEMGIELLDTRSGTIWIRKAGS
mgnify:CR=1 FL=1